MVDMVDTASKLIFISQWDWKWCYAGFFFGLLGIAFKEKNHASTFKNDPLVPSVNVSLFFLKKIDFFLDLRTSSED